MIRKVVKKLLKSDLFDKIGLSKNEQELYYQYSKSVGEYAEECAYSYMRRKQELETVLDTLHKFSDNDISIYTLDLIFLFACTSYLYEDYVKNNISEDIFVDTMKDITYKIDECKNVKNIFGTFVINWFEGFLKMKRFAFGRLQFDVWERHKKTAEVNGYKVDEETFALNCHIPSSGPLDNESVIQSLASAYKFFENKIENDVLPVFCQSWLLNPSYMQIFEGSSPNIAKFASNFTIYDSVQQDLFNDAWRIFGVEYNGDVSILPRDTRLQRGFVEYIKSGGKFGTGAGILLFDGEKIL